MYHLCGESFYSMKNPNSNTIPQLAFIAVFLLGVGFLHLKIGGAINTRFDDLRRPAIRDRFYYQEFSSGFYSTVRPVFRREIFTKATENESKSVRGIPSLIMSSGQLDPQRMIQFLQLNNQLLTNDQINELVDAYLEEAAYEGVNHDIAFSQMCLETGFLKFGGDVQREQNNFCGLGAVGNSEPGLAFGSMRDGVRAHIQHLKAYASTDSLKRQKVDARFDYVKRGTATNYFELTGKWAVDPKYGLKLQSILERLYAGDFESMPNKMDR